MLPEIDPQTGALPVGRFPVDMASVRAAYVDHPRFAASTTRAEIWGHFDAATTGLRRILPVAYVWIAGSFLTDKVDPDDIDVVYWCEDRHIDAVSDVRDRQILETFARNRVRSQTGLRVDTRFGRWHVHPDADHVQSAKHQTYSMTRGYWDDFWLRQRSGAKTDPRVREDALPRRGYVEVILDGVYVV